MKVKLSEITDQDKEIFATDADAWALKTVEELDEENLKTPHTLKARFNLRKVDEVVVASGDLNTQIHLLCSRCATPFAFPIREHFTALYCKDKEMAGIAYLDAHSNPRGQNKGYARHAHADGKDTDGNDEAATDLEITYLAEDFIDLPEVLHEQLQIRIPYQPLCKEDCKGICANCGADWNLGRCACPKILGKNPFASLKNLKS